MEIRPARLEAVVSANKSYVGKEATVIGWGRTRQVCKVQQRFAYLPPLPTKM